MKKLFILFFFQSFILLGQDNGIEISTLYSNSNGGKVGIDNKIFKIVDDHLHIIDKDFNTKTKYGPLQILSQKYSEDGYYQVTFSPSHTMKRYLGYRYLFSEKGGKLLCIVEIEASSKQFVTYYTEFGYNSLIREKPTDVGGKNLDIKKLILGSKSLNELYNLIEYEFEREERTEIENNEYNISYKIVDLISVIVLFDSLDNYKRFTFIMPFREKDIIKNTLNDKHKLTYDIDTEMETLATENLKYYFKENEEWGLIIIE